MIEPARRAIRPGRTGWTGRPAQRRSRTVAALALTALVVAGCAPSMTEKERAEAPPRFEPARFADLPGWKDDSMGPALKAMLDSCPRLTRTGTGDLGSAADWREACTRAGAVDANDPAAVRAYFERNFTPLRVTWADGDPQGLFTGYYEPSLHGARKRGGRYTVPLYLRPNDLVSVDLGRFSDDLKGKRIAGRVAHGRLVPYPDRAQIERGALKGRGLELVWVDSAADAFFLQIQGSGRIVLRDGSVLRVGFAGNNGRPYSSIGRALIDRGAISREDMSMQAIRSWLAAHPAEGAKLMRTNRSYVFFRRLDGRGPISALGVPLTPGRSIAVDRAEFPLGLPVWLDTVLPDAAATPFRRLMMAQDTGGAIRGAVRADVFWGAGEKAAERAGRMKSPGRYWFLRPRAAAPTS